MAVFLDRGCVVLEQFCTHSGSADPSPINWGRGAGEGQAALHLLLPVTFFGAPSRLSGAVGNVRVHAYVRAPAPQYVSAASRFDRMDLPASVLRPVPRARPPPRARPGAAHESNRTRGSVFRFFAPPRATQNPSEFLGLIGLHCIERQS